MFQINACLAQLVERTTFNRVVVGSIPTMGVHFLSASQGAHKKGDDFLLKPIF